MSVVTNGLESYHSDQLAVERRDSGLVTEGLRRMGVTASEHASSGLLGLTLLDLTGTELAAAGLRQDPDLMEAAGQGRAGGAAVLTDLDMVLFALRRSLRATYHGWQPAMGKNRLVGDVQGSPYIKGGVGVPGKAGPISIPRPGPRLGTRVAVLDTGLFAHPDLVGRYLGDSMPYPPSAAGGDVARLLSPQA